MCERTPLIRLAPGLKPRHPFKTLNLVLMTEELHPDPKNNSAFFFKFSMYIPCFLNQSLGKLESGEHFCKYTVY